jgi:alpha-ribazole phosphatase
MTLWLLRHAQPCVAPGVCYGVLDMAAEAEATRQAAAALAEVLPQDLSVWVSPLQRCELLAQFLRGLRPDLTFKTDLRLVEMNFGAWEGVPWADVPRTALDAWTTDFGEHRFGGIESANMVLARTRAAWSDTLAATRLSGAAGAVWITHAGVIRAVSLLAQGVQRVDDAAQWPRAAPAFGQWSQVPMASGQR